jgi:hypothetical protein
MISPIEVSHNNVINRLQVIKNTISRINKMAPEIDGQLKMMYSMAKLDSTEVYSKYMLGASPYIVNYYNDSNGVLSEYWNFINSKNIIGLMDGCVRRLYSILDNLQPFAEKSDIDEAMLILSHEQDYKMNAVVPQTEKNTCQCGGTTSIYSDTSEYKCKDCGMTTTIYGVIFDDTQLYNQDGQKPKQGRHYPSLHCKLWIARIQAWTGPEIPDAVFERIKKCIKRDNINAKKIRCRQVRKYLKECGYTSYNNFVPYIRKVITGIAPPQLTQEELNQFYSIFNKVAAVLKRLRPQNNITYYPYIIYKILDSMLNNSPRKARILECIHLQSNNTMRFIDDIYGQVCDEVEELENKPTNKHEYEFYL